MHVLPRVREIEERFADSLTGIGVHAGKFPAERPTERVAAACDRLAVNHAVVNDRQFRMWHDYAVRAWPTVVVIDPEGYIALIAPGEFDIESMSDELMRIEKRAESRGTLVRGSDPVVTNLPRHDGPLRFPTRAIVAGGQLWISDTGHGRVLQCEWDASTKRASVLTEHSGFAEPRGLAELGGKVYVADRAGHTIWRLGGCKRERVAGTGEMAAHRVASGPAQLSELRSPWGLAATADGRLAVAMAGSHQLWTLDPGDESLELLAGMGAEDIADGVASRAALAQPTGVVRMGDRLGFSDCESSAVRVLGARSVSTLVGTGLFDFGDRPGVGDDALLQHCEDLALHGNVLAVADTYNDRMKLVDPKTRECIPWQGEAGEQGALREPGGVWSDGELLLVADTGNHRIVAVESDGSLTVVSVDASAHVGS